MKLANSDATKMQAAEPWARHLLGLINPALVIAGNLLGGAHTLMGVILVWVISPLLDLALGETQTPRPAPQSGRPYELILWMHGVSHFAVLGSFVWLTVQEGWSPWWFCAVLSSGLAAATSAIVTAHELGHRRRGSPGWWLARALLMSIHYPHFTTEHNIAHHKNVATDQDPASARANESIWSFWPRTISGQLASAVAIHQRKGQRGLRNPVVRNLILQTLAIGVLSGAAFYGASWAFPLLIGWLSLSALAILTLEYVNYLRHYGLRRPIGSQRFEAPYAWNTEARWSRWSLLELTRHSDHHLHAGVPFWKLRPHPEAPRLPAGYYACWWPCLIPPLWRRIMARRAPGL